jgi:hypothetical protein
MRTLAVLVVMAALGAVSAAPADASERLAWTRLTPVQQQALGPLQADWATLSPDRQAKWLQVAARFPMMSAGDRQRLHTHMVEWARMTTQERRTARLQFQEVRRVSTEHRQAAWTAYQALPETERQRLADQRVRPGPRPGATPPASTQVPKAKSNVVQSSPVSPKRAATAAMQQSRAGATTSPMNQSPQPPSTIQHGLPKIAATPAFVDPVTLLPRRGPQGAAAVRSAQPGSAAQP